MIQKTITVYFIVKYQKVINIYQIKIISLKILLENILEIIKKEYLLFLNTFSAFKLSEGLRALFAPAFFAKFFEKITSEKCRGN